MRKEVENASAVGLCCTHKATVRYLLGFLFRKVIIIIIIMSTFV